MTEPVFDAERQVPLRPRLDRRRPGLRLVRPVHAPTVRTHARIYAVAAAQGRCRIPFAKESDEEKASPCATKRRDKKDDEAGVAKAGRPAAPTRGRTSARGLRRHRRSRILALPIAGAERRALEAGEAGQIYYLRAMRTAGGGELHRYDLAKRKDEA